ncbi:hypothetical protein NMY22_g20300 [Coprinellus aureogranulatus]|nr:hypothetical protein NMY22_g20300 [Coprinellus aureogranulatus]
MFVPQSTPPPKSTAYSSPSISYRPDEYYLHGHSPVQNIPSGAPRTFSHDDHRQGHAFYPDQYYPGRSKSYDNRNALPPPLPPYNQSYDRHHQNSPPSIHLSAYRHTSSHSHSNHQYVERPSPLLPPLKRTDLPNMVDDFGLPPSHSGYGESPTIKSESIVCVPFAAS